MACTYITLLFSAIISSGFWAPHIVHSLVLFFGQMSAQTHEAKSPVMAGKVDVVENRLDTILYLAMQDYICLNRATKCEELLSELIKCLEA